MPPHDEMGGRSRSSSSGPAPMTADPPIDQADSEIGDSASGSSAAAGEIAWNTFHQTPAGRAIGLQVYERDTGTCTLVVPCLGPALQASRDRVHPGAVTIAVDQCLGSAASGERPRHLVTVDLRLDWHEPIPPGRDMVCQGTVQATNGRSVNVSGNVHAGLGGPIVARASGQFLLGASAGGFSERVSAPMVGLGERAWPQFDAFLGARTGQDSLVLDPGPHRIGSTYLPALHGGVTAAGLLEAMLHLAGDWHPDTNVSLLSSTTQFLKAGVAKDVVILSADWVRRGRSVGLLEARAHQPGKHEPIAIAQVTVLAADGSDRIDPRLW